MAMHLRAVKPPPLGPDAPAVGKHDAYVAAQLRRAERRIRNLDVAGAEPDPGEIVEEEVRTRHVRQAGPAEVVRLRVIEVRHLPEQPKR